ncbi:hypothetical protein GCM10023313_36120 [Mucilaginibacter defluvii]|uniref:G/U mismatch-specific uracil-DNA glycosylase n=2 Tax=Mucilaginibacter defluvii TaxID=1196019 RepID=A0ABP9G818_9SPHI
MFNIYETPFSNDYEVRKQLLYNNNIALWDVLESCESIGSADDAIKNEKANDFKLFYQKYPAIKKVYFTSKAAEKYYDRYVLKSPDKSYFVLPSPSRANTWKSFEEKLQEWNIIIH